MNGWLPTRVLAGMQSISPGATTAAIISGPSGLVARPHIPSQRTRSREFFREFPLWDVYCRLRAPLRLVGVALEVFGRHRGAVTRLVREGRAIWAAGVRMCPNGRLRARVPRARCRAASPGVAGGMRGEGRQVGRRRHVDWGCPYPKSCSGLYPSVLAVLTSGRPTPAHRCRRAGVGRPSVGIGGGVHPVCRTRPSRRERGAGRLRSRSFRRCWGAACDTPTGSGCVGGARAVVTGAVPVLTGGSPRNMTGRAENPYGDPPSGHPSKTNSFGDLQSSPNRSVSHVSEPSQGLGPS